MCMCCLSVGVYGQLIVDLQKGGAAVRSKDIHDYDVEHKDLRQQREDSIQYTDHLRRAFTALHEDSLNMAKRHFEQALDLRPDAPGNFVVQHNLGRIALAQERYGDALQTFTKILKEHPNNMEVRYDRATTYLKMNNPQAAIEDADILFRAASSDSVRELLYFLRGAAEMRTRLYSEARKDLEEVLRLNPENTNAPLLLVIALQQGGRPKEARQQLDAYIDKHASDFDARYLRADMCTNSEDYATALSDLDVLVAAEPRNTDLLLRRAVVLRRLGRKADARKDADAAVALGVPRSVVKDIF